MSLYAATHPHERFAEAVRMALTLGGDEARIRSWTATRGAAPVVAEQIAYAAEFLRRYD